MNFWIENKDAITTIGVLLTILVSLISLYFTVRNNKAIHYVNSITKNRLEWMYKFKDYLSEFVKMTASHEHKNYIEGPEKISNHFDELAKLVFTIEMHLNFKGEIDQKIINLINEIVEIEHVSYFYTKYASYINEREIIKGIVKRIDESEGVTKDEMDEMLSRNKDMLLYIENNTYMKNFVEKKFTNGKSISSIQDSYIELMNVYFSVLEYGLKATDITQRLFVKLQKEVRVYLKFEWNRIKFEAKGRKYSIRKQMKDLKQLYSEYDEKCKVNS